MTIKVRYLNPDKDREWLIHCYVTALDAGELETAGEVLAAALYDPLLDRMITEAHQAMAAELGLNVFPLAVPPLPPLL